MARHSRRKTKMEKNPRETEAISSESIPLDLVAEILLRLPAKTLTRFVSVSKLFARLIRSRYFIRSFSHRSSKQKQRLLIAFSGIDKEKGCENWSFFSSSLKETSSSPVFLSRTACHVPDLRIGRPDCVHGLLSFVYGKEQIISNPSTGKSITLPSVKSRRNVLKRYFGYDPVDEQYKVLCVTEPMFGLGTRVAPGECRVLTLRSSHQNAWRKIECSIPHRPISDSVCINGVLYFYALMGTNTMQSCLMRFDVSSETFDFLTRLPVEVRYHLENLRLINYQGNVASVNNPIWPYSFDLWVVEDFKKQQWLKVSLSLSPWTYKFWPSLLDIRGTAQTGEIIIYAPYVVDDYYFILHDRKMNDLKVVKVEVNSSEYEFERFSGVLSFLDYVESVVLS